MKKTTENRLFMEAERRTLTRCGRESAQKELKYDGTNPFPMELLKELSKVKNKLYEDEEVRWIDQHSKRTQISGGP